MTGPIAIAGCYVATVDPAGSEYPSGHVVIDRGRIAAAGPGPVPPEFATATRIDGSGRLVTPGLVNTHSHLNQWITRGYATDETLFGWLQTLYPIWARLTPELLSAAAAANLAWLALTGCYLEHRSPVRVPGGCGRPAGGGDPGRPPDRDPLPPDPRLDEPGAVGRRPAAGLGGRGPRHDPGRLAGRDRPLARPVRRTR